MNSFRSRAARDRERDRAADRACSRPAAAIVQETRGWDERRRHAFDAQQRRSARLPLLSRSRSRAARNRARARRAAARGAAGAAVAALRALHEGVRHLRSAAATQLVDNPPLAQYFDDVVARSENPQQASNFVLGDLSRLANESGVAVADSKVDAEASRRADRTRRSEDDQLEDRQRAARADVGRRPVRPRRSSSAKGSRRPAIRPRSSGSSTTCSPPTQRSSPITKPARRTCSGFSSVQVMKASRGKADPALGQRAGEEEARVTRGNPMRLADARTLDVLDFARVRERVVAATRTQRGRALASDLLPDRDFAIVRGSNCARRRCDRSRASADVTIMPAIDTAALDARPRSSARRWRRRSCVRSATRWRRRRPRSKAVREHPDLAAVVAPYTPLRELQRSHLRRDRRTRRGARSRLARARANPAQPRAGAGRSARSHLPHPYGAKYAKAIQDRVVTIRDGRFVIPIKAEFAGMMPGIVHDTSSSGQTLFVEPLAALESNNRVRTLQIEEEREVQRILQALSARVGAHAAQIEANVEVLATLDLLAAKAELRAPRRRDDAGAERRAEPDRSTTGAIRCSMRARCRNRCALDDATRLLVISGPNMGGKTVALKMVGLFVVMTYCGMQLPAGGATCIGRFERIVADIGDEQSIAANASTFSAHLQRMREILDDADARTLAIVDEIGGGTEPNAGAALAVAMLERLLACGARAIVSTHSTELKLFAHCHARGRERERALRSQNLPADLRARYRRAGAVAGLSARHAPGRCRRDRCARDGAARGSRARLRSGAGRARAAQQRASRSARCAWRANAETSRRRRTCCTRDREALDAQRRRFGSERRRAFGAGPARFRARAAAAR